MCKTNDRSFFPIVNYISEHTVFKNNKFLKNLKNLKNVKNLKDPKNLKNRKNLNNLKNLSFSMYWALFILGFFGFFTNANETLSLTSEKKKSKIFQIQESGIQIDIPYNFSKFHHIAVIFRADIKRTLCVVTCKSSQNAVVTFAQSSVKYSGNTEIL